METTHKAVYPVHKLETITGGHIDDTDIIMENDKLDFRINKHYFDYLQRNILPENNLYSCPHLMKFRKALCDLDHCISASIKAVIQIQRNWVYLMILTILQ